MVGREYGGKGEREVVGGRLRGKVRSALISRRS